MANENNTVKQVCNAIGNPWIICRSRSYSGRVYYFNTATGDAVWNLSDAEIEKAKSRTKSLEGQPGVNIAECPEPKGPPICSCKYGTSQEHPVHNLCSPNIFNKQIINNKFSKQAFQFSSCDMCAAGKSTPRIIIAPIAIPQLQNQTESSVSENIDPKVFIQNTSMKLSHRFQNLNVKPRTPSKKHFHESNRLTPGLSNENYTQRPHDIKKDNQFGISDLRQKLSAKRRFSGRRQLQSEDHEKQFSNTSDDQHEENYENDSTYYKKQERFSDCDSVYQKTQDDWNGSECGSVNSRRENEKVSYTSDVDSDWLEDNLEFRGSKLNLDVTNLKKLAKPNANLKPWYIATDKNILMCHLHLFNMLFNSDDECHVMVSQKVIAELNEAARAASAPRRRKNRAKRATAFLSEQFNACRALIGECSSDPEEAHYLLKCCIQLAEKNYHVVLLSNDEEMQKIKDITYIPIFNVIEVKNFLAKEDQETDDPEPAPCLPKINITIPNSLHLSESNKKSGNEQETQSDNKFVTNESMEESLNQTITVSPKKCTIETGVQTELTPSLLTPTMDINANHNNDNEETRLNSDKSQNIQFSEDNNPSCVSQIKILSNTCTNYNTQSETGEFQETRTTSDNHIRQTPLENLCLDTTDNIDTHLKISDKVSINFNIPNINFKLSDQSQDTQFKEDDNVILVPQVSKNSNTSESVNTHAKISDITESTAVISAGQMSQIKKTNSTCGVETRLQGSEDTHDTALKTPKKSKIRLKRNISNQESVNTNKELEIKQFKWRRNRTASNTRTDELKSNVTDCLNQIVPTSHLNTSATSVDNSDRSSSIFLQRSASDNLVIEETSTSGVVSNTSVFDSESDIVNIHNSNNIGYENQSIDRNLMFDVNDRHMEDNLRMRYEEWFSRFVQIMEEVMTQVLVQNSKFLYSMISPPWTMFEATECIKTQFCDNPDVVDAANRLSNVNGKLSVSAGKIRELEPQEFMEMYSYGVYLVDALQDVLSNCEDLQIAAVSLSKLFQDIQNPNLNCSNNETFDNSHHECSTDTAEISKIQNEDDVFRNTNITYPSHETTTHIENYNDKKVGSFDLRSKKRTEKVKFVRNIDIKSTFLNSLELQKRGIEANENDTITSQNGSKNKPLSPNKQNHIRNLFAGNLNMTDTNIESDLEICHSKEYTQPKFVRNFNKFPEFEYRIKNGLPDPYENDDNEIFSEDDCCGNVEDEELEFAPYKLTENTIESSLSVSKSDEVLDSFFQTFVDEIKTTFLQVQTFCVSVKEEMTHSCDSSQKDKLYEKAEKAHMCIGNINNNLKSILYREMHDPDNNMQSAFIRAGFDVGFNDKQCVAYKDVIAKSASQAEILLDALKLIMDVTKD